VNTGAAPQQMSTVPAASALEPLRPPGVAAPASPGPAGAVAYAGLVTRTIAFGLDAVFVYGAAALVAVVFGIGVSLLSLSSGTNEVLAAIGVALWVLWPVLYFGFFWSTTGQTPGCRLMEIRILDARTMRPVKPARAAARAVAVLLAAVPLLGGFVMMLWDDRCRCLQDRLAGTVVIYAPPKHAGTAHPLAQSLRQQH
jgi:uncharacterized RDD family membrane protein YckC